MNVRRRMALLATTAVLGGAVAATAPAHAVGSPTTDRTVAVRQNSAAYADQATARQNQLIAEQFTRRPDGTRVSPQEIVYDGGNVVYNVGPTDSTDCASGYACLWQYEDYTGRMLKFKETGKNQNLSNWGFVNKTSSWRNRRSHRAWLYDYADGRGWNLCMDHGSVSSSMGSRDNDAESIYLSGTSSSC
jgi:Peptidase inhibitor family I36